MVFVAVAMMVVRVFIVDLKCELFCLLIKTISPLESNLETVDE